MQKYKFTKVTWSKLSCFKTGGPLLGVVSIAILCKLASFSIQLEYGYLHFFEQKKAFVEQIFMQERTTELKLSTN